MKDLKEVLFEVAMENVKEVYQGVADRVDVEEWLEEQEKKPKLVLVTGESLAEGRGYTSSGVEEMKETLAKIDKTIQEDIAVGTALTAIMVEAGIHDEFLKRMKAELKEGGEGNEAERKETKK